MEQLNSILTTLAEKLNVAAEHLYEALLLQCRIDAILYILGFVGCIIATIFVITYVRWLFFIEKEGLTNWDHAYHADREGFHIAILTLTSIIYLSWLLCTLISIQPMLTALINPDFYVVSKILSLIGG